jgi:mRNA-degrading endonuclease RelE of RelBE toxin-antitoxin system
MTYELKYASGWDKHFKDFDAAVKQRILKKLEQLKTKEKSRHLEHGMPYFIEEVGGYRIAFQTDLSSRTKTIYFIGNHGQYKRWYSPI